jgi:TRAP-type mannitol/chloroaromatic compound transport system permease large subunit
MEIIPILLIVLICSALLLGYPVAFTLAGTSILFALLGITLDFFDPNLFKTLPMRIFGIMNNQTLLLCPCLSLWAFF